eukprot:gene40750-50418_t
MEWIFITLASLFAGFIDAIVGGGGLILTPALFAAFPGTAPATLFGTNKAGSVWGTAMATWQYSRRVEMRWRALLPAAGAGFAGAFAGAWTVTALSPDFLRKVLPLVLLVVVLALLHLEHRAQKRMRFAAGGVGRAGSSEAQPLVLRGGPRVLAWVVCVVPVLMGFVAPIVFMLRPLAADWSVLPWDRFVEWAWHSVRLGSITAAIAVALALAMA